MKISKYICFLFFRIKLLVRERERERTRTLCRITNKHFFGVFFQEKGDDCITFNSDSLFIKPFIEICSVFFFFFPENIAQCLLIKQLASPQMVVLKLPKSKMRNYTNVGLLLFREKKNAQNICYLLP